MCGIIGFNGKNPDVNILKILALYNDTRGGDGCGYYVNGEITKYSEFSLKTFGKLFPAKEGLEFKVENPEESQSILMHTRKSSVGGNTNANCHPFLVEKIKGYKTSVVGVHNGTIRNIDDLAEKHLGDAAYDLPTTMTDSEVLFKIISKTGKLDVLSEYDGGAALAWVNPKEPTKTYVFKGATLSKNNQTFWGHGGWIEPELDEQGFEEERPLNYAYLKEGVYFSSLVEPLAAVGLTEIFTVPNNSVMVFENGKLLKQYKIVKKEPYQIPRAPVRHIPIGYTPPEVVSTNFTPTTAARKEGLLYVHNLLYYAGVESTPAHGVYYIDKIKGSDILFEAWISESWSELISKTQDTDWKESLKKAYSDKTQYAFFYDGVLIDNSLGLFLEGYLHNCNIVKLIERLGGDNDANRFTGVNIHQLQAYTNQLIYTFGGNIKLDGKYVTSNTIANMLYGGPSVKIGSNSKLVSLDTSRFMIEYAKLFLKSIKAKSKVKTSHHFEIGDDVIMLNSNHSTLKRGSIYTLTWVHTNSTNREHTSLGMRVNGTEFLINSKECMLYDKDSFKESFSDVKYEGEDPVVLVSKHFIPDVSDFFCVTTTPNSADRSKGIEKFGIYSATNVSKILPKEGATHLLHLNGDFGQSVYMYYPSECRIAMVVDDDDWDDKCKECAGLGYTDLEVSCGTCQGTGENSPFKEEEELNNNIKIDYMYTKEALGELHDDIGISLTTIKGIDFNKLPDTTQSKLRNLKAMLTGARGILDAEKKAIEGKVKQQVD